MLDGCQQIDMTCRGLRRVSVEAGRRKRATEVVIRERGRIDEPAAASSIAVHQDEIAVRFAKIRTRQIGNLELHAPDDGNLLRRETSTRPPFDGRRDDAVELALSELRSLAG